MEAVLADENELNFRIYEIPTSAIQVNGKKVKHFDFISSCRNEDCSRALQRIYPRIDMAKIHTIIDETPFISDLQKHFYKTILEKRKERILDYSIGVLNKK